MPLPLFLYLRFSVFLHQQLPDLIGHLVAAHRTVGLELGMQLGWDVDGQSLHRLFGSLLAPGANPGIHGGIVSGFLGGGLGASDEGGTDGRLSAGSGSISRGSASHLHVVLWEVTTKK